MMLFAWQAQGFRALMCSVMSMFDASGAESVERLQISCYGHVTLQGCLGSTFSWQAQYF